MDRFDRIYYLHRIFRERRTPISREDLERKLECSRNTVLRAIEDLRDFLNAPLVYDRDANGYRYAAEQQGAYELPGLWFNASEIQALLVLVELLDAAQPGLLTPALAPIRRRVEDILHKRGAGGAELPRRIRILQMAPRTIELDNFRMVAGAVLQRRRLRVLYHGRARDATTERWLSPQRLLHYRANWYLDAWCHLRGGLRSFSLDRLHVSELGARAEDIDEARLEAHFTDAYGIFAGPAAHTAVLRFTSEAARWVADEQWHPQQKTEVLTDGRLELRVPYGDPRELMMDIRKYGADVEVLAPKTLRRAVAASLTAAAAQYGK